MNAFALTRSVTVFTIWNSIYSINILLYWISSWLVTVLATHFTKWLITHLYRQHLANCYWKTLQNILVKIIKKYNTRYICLKVMTCLATCVCITASITRGRMNGFAPIGLVTIFTICNWFECIHLSVYSIFQK